MEKPTLLLVDDHEHILKQLSWALREDFLVHLAHSKDEALCALREVRPRLMTVDLALSPGKRAHHEGFEILQAALCTDPMIKAVIITSDQEEATAVRAVRMGAFDYFVKPLPLAELRGALKRAAYLAEIERRDDIGHQASDDDSDMIGRSPAITELRRLLDRVAETDFPVLVLGESGVGKELVAHAIWKQSRRRHQPLVVVNCAAIPATLLESELFGHEKGAFTGAHAQKRGKFERADRGTLFLDEIGDLSLELQAKILRFLQERTIERLGSTRSIQLDVRTVAATNRDLERDVQAKLFREDLYYRLKVLPIRVPPLRERGDDVLLLANHFLERLATELGTPRKRLSRDAELALTAHTWPGNVRELENTLRAAAIRSSVTIVSARHLDLATADKPTCDLRLARDELERSMVERALQRNGGIISRAARDLAISRVTLYELLQKHGFRSANGRGKNR